MAALIQVVTTTATREDAGRIGRTLVEERLAACAQVSGPVESTYRWKGTIEQATEWYCVIKTTADRFEPLRARIRALHPYETPEILAFDARLADPDYAGWVAAEVARPNSGQETP